MDSMWLSKQLAQMTRENYRRGQFFENVTEKSQNLLRFFDAHTQQTIERIYVLNGALNVKKIVERSLSEGPIIHYSPRSVAADGTAFDAPEHVFNVQSGLIDPSHIALIVDDSWRNGRYKSAAIKYLERRGYDRQNIFVLHCFGNGWDCTAQDRDQGFVMGNPVLLNAEMMLRYFETGRAT